MKLKINKGNYLLWISAIVLFTLSGCNNTNNNPSISSETTINNIENNNQSIERKGDLKDRKDINIKKDNIKKDDNKENIYEKQETLRNLKQNDDNNKLNKKNEKMKKIENVLQEQQDIKPIFPPKIQTKIDKIVDKLLKNKNQIKDSYVNEIVQLNSQIIGLDSKKIINTISKKTLENLQKHSDLLGVAKNKKDIYKLIVADIQSVGKELLIKSKREKNIFNVDSMLKQYVSLNKKLKKQGLKTALTKQDLKIIKQFVEDKLKQYKQKHGKPNKNNKLIEKLCNYYTSANKKDKLYIDNGIIYILDYGANYDALCKFNIVAKKLGIYPKYFVDKTKKNTIIMPEKGLLNTIAWYIALKYTPSIINIYWDNNKGVFDNMKNININGYLINDLGLNLYQFNNPLSESNY